MAKPPLLEDVIRQSIYEYPTLYRIPGNPELSRLLVLDHIFLCIGTGYEWHPDGYLYYDNGRADKGRKTLPKGFFEKRLYYLTLEAHNRNTGEPIDYKAQLAEIKATFDAEGRFYYVVTGKGYGERADVIFEAVDADDAYPIFEKYSVRNTFFDDSDMPEELKAKLRRVHVYEASGVISDLDDEGNWVRERQHNPYPIGKYSPLTEIWEQQTDSCHVENFALTHVQPDWLKGAVDVAKSALAFYEDPEACKRHTYHPEQTISREKYDFERREKEGGAEAVAKLRETWNYKEGETIEQKCKRVWKNYHRRQLSFLRKFLKKYDKP